MRLNKLWEYTGPMSHRCNETQVSFKLWISNFYSAILYNFATLLSGATIPFDDGAEWQKRIHVDDPNRTEQNAYFGWFYSVWIVRDSKRKFQNIIFFFSKVMWKIYSWPTNVKCLNFTTLT